MNTLNPDRQVIELPLEDGNIIYVDARIIDRERPVALRSVSFDDVISQVEIIAKKCYLVLETIAPSKATVEFGIEVGLTTKGLAALIVDGSGKGNMKITLEWSAKKESK